MGGFYQSAPQDDGLRWRPLAIAVAILVVIGVMVWGFSRKAQRPASGQAAVDPYIANLQVKDLHLSTAQNFVGATVTYLEGTIINNGDKTVTGATVQCVFRNSLGEVVQNETQPLQVLKTPLGEPDYVPLSAAPLLPNHTEQFRLIFEHISADWNQGFPEVRIVKLELK